VKALIRFIPATAWRSARSSASFGDFPVSVTVQGNHAYVLNALGGGSLTGYRIDGQYLAPVSGSYRALHLGTTAKSQFTATPGQVAFTPDGAKLPVTTKGATNAVDVLAVQADGRLSASPTVNSLPGDVPFAVAYWMVRAGQYFYTSNAGNGSLSGYSVSGSGGLSALGNTATDAGTVDAASAAGGRFVYVQAGKAGIVDEFAMSGGGALTKVGSVTVTGGAGGEGIAAA